MTVGRQPKLSIKETIFLQQEFKGYLQGKNHAQSTIEHYTREIRLFFAWIDKDEIAITKPDVLNYLEYLKTERNLENISRARIVNSLNHYFTFLLKEEHILQLPTGLIVIRGTQKKKLYNTYYTFEELQQLCDNYYHTFIRTFDDSHMPKNQRKHNLLSRQRNYVILGFLIYQGLRTNELGRITLDDLDLMKGQVRLSGSKKNSERILSLNAAQIGALMDYLQNIRPQFLALRGESNQLFLTLPEVSKNRTSQTSLMSIFKVLPKHIKTLDSRFLKLEQLRASVIINWIKIEGLRKAQYLAGHRYISTTEKYQSNDFESLIDDITKYDTF